MDDVPLFSGFAPDREPVDPNWRATWAASRRVYQLTVEHPDWDAARMTRAIRDEGLTVPEKPSVAELMWIAGSETERRGPNWIDNLPWAPK